MAGGPEPTRRDLPPGSRRDRSTYQAVAEANRGVPTTGRLGRRLGRPWNHASVSDARPGQHREVLRLAVPAFLALVAEPLFLLADSAIVGRLGTAAARRPRGRERRAAHVGGHLRLPRLRHHGRRGPPARRRRTSAAAIAAGIDGTWLAIGLGAVTRGRRRRSAAGPLAPLFGASPARHRAGGDLPAHLRARHARHARRPRHDRACCAACRTPARRSSPPSAGFGAQHRAQPVVRLRAALGHRRIRLGHRHRPDRHGRRPRAWSSSRCAARTACPLRAHPARVLARRPRRHPAARAHPGPARGAARDDLGGGRARRRPARGATR